MKHTGEQQVLFQLLAGKQIELPAGFNPDLFFQLLRRHKLIPLGEKVLPFLPAEIQVSWKADLKQWAARAMLFFHELKHIVEDLESNGIKVTVVKGPLLSYQLYGSFHSRYYSDLDIIISPDDMERAIAILKTLNYSLLTPSEDLFNDGWTEYLRYNNDVVLKNRNIDIVLELHIGIYVEQLINRFDQQEFLLNTEFISIQDTQFRIFTSEYYLLYLCFHGAKHMFFRLSWVKDIAELINKKDLNHAAVVEAAKKLGLVKILYISLRLAQRYFSISLPNEYDTILHLKRYSYMVHLNETIILGPGELVYEHMRKREIQQDLHRGIDKVSIKHYYSQILYLIGLRNGLKGKFKFIIYQFRKRIHS